MGLLALGMSLSSLPGEERRDRQGFSLKTSSQSLESSAALIKEPDFGDIPLYFIPNKGQVDKEALFYATTSSYTLWLTKEGLVFDSAQRALEPEESGENLKYKNRANEEFNRDVSGLLFLNANEGLEVRPGEEAAHRVNYLIGNDPTKWRMNIPTSGAVLYREIYKNIDLKVYGIEKQIEYDWVVKPGGKPEEIRFVYRGVKGTGLDKDGNLVIGGKYGELRHHKPTGWQVIAGRKVDVEVGFELKGKDEYGFRIKEHDRNFDLIIDPMILVYSSYLGGASQFEAASGVAVDGSGAAYVTGYTNSADFPIKNAYQKTNKGASDVFVTKFSSSGKALVYSTYLGGSESDGASAIAVDKNGAVYIAGGTSSPNFPIKNAVQKALRGDGDVFVAKLSPSGASLVYSTYLGGSRHDSEYPEEGASGIAVDSVGAVYISGKTWCTDFPTKNAFQKALGKAPEADAFITKFSPSGKSILYSTYLGGAYDDGVSGVAVDGSGAVYVTGTTLSTNFPAKNAYQKTLRGESDVFVSKLSPSGKSIVYSTYLGGSGDDRWSAIALDSRGAAYITGVTESADFPVKNAYQKTYGGGWEDVFVTKFSATGASLDYSGYLGGTKYEYGCAIAVDGSGAAYIAGYTASTNFPTKNAFQKTYGGGYEDGFIAKLSSGGKNLVYASYLGGSENDDCDNIAVDGRGAAYVIGNTRSPNFPLKNAFQKTLQGYEDGFVAKFSFASKPANY